MLDDASCHWCVCLTINNNHHTATHHRRLLYQQKSRTPLSLVVCICTTYYQDPSRVTQLPITRFIYILHTHAYIFLIIYHPPGIASCLMYFLHALSFPINVIHSLSTFLLGWWKSVRIDLLHFIRLDIAFYITTTPLLSPSIMDVYYKAHVVYVCVSSLDHPSQILYIDKNG